MGFVFPILFSFSLLFLRCPQENKQCTIFCNSTFTHLCGGKSPTALTQHFAMSAHSISSLTRKPCVRERERYDNLKIWRSSNQTETSRWSVTDIQLSRATPSLALLPPTGDQSGRTDDRDRHPIRFDDMFIRTRCRSLFKLACDKQQERQGTGKKRKKKEENAKRSYSLAMSHAKRKHKWFTNNTYNVEHKNAKTRRRRRRRKKETENKTTTTKNRQRLKRWSRKLNTTTSFR